MSLLLMSLGVGGGLAFGRWLAQRSARREAARAAITSPGAHDAQAAEPNPDEVLWSRFPCRLGDVIVHPSGDEAWLAGAIVLAEDVPAAVLFVAPEAKSDLAVYVCAKPAEEIFWLSPIAEADWSGAAVATDPPTTIEVAGEPFGRIRRLPFRTERLGEGTPDLGKEIVLAEYKSMRSLERRVISISGAASAGTVSRAWIGTAIAIGVCDVLPAGQRALPEPLA
ncbi:MAG: hypothetical protein ABI461_09815 [Polyangiaceae bacterium]